MSELALKLIAENKAKHARGEDARVLDLGNCGLTEVPEEVGELVWLEEIIFSEKWQEYNFTKRMWESQKSINKGEKNILLRLPNNFSLLKNLKKLILDGTGLLYTEPISKLYDLETICMNSCNFNDLEFLRNSNKLKFLFIPSTRVSDLSPISGMKKLEILYCSNTRIKDLSPISELKSLKLLYCYGSKISNLSPLSKLEKLQILDCSETEVNNLSAISKIESLRKIECKDTKISFLPKNSKWGNLELLNIAETNVKDLSPILYLLEKGIEGGWFWHGGYGILFMGCPLQYPPIEIAKQGNSAILQYFEELERAKAKGETIILSEAKCIIVGEGGVGKTSLVRKLLNPKNPLPTAKETTQGIDVHPHDLKLPDGSDFRLNIWDFGGQEIYHATHQFFLTKRSLYILLDDTRKDEKTVNDPTFNYWLQVAELYGGGSPLLIVQNEKGDRSKQLDLKGMQGRFGFVKDARAANLLSCRGLDEVWAAIQYWLKQLPHIGEEQPKAWLDIRRELERLAREEGRDFISLEKYYEVCSQHSIPERERALFLSGYLHDFGAFLHFQDHPLLRKMLVLNNQWATDAVYKVLDFEPVKKAFGRFTRADLANIWSDARYTDQHDELLALMEKFELCYKLPDEKTETWLAPQLLSVLQPDALVWDESDNLQIRYEYEFMPKGLLSQHIVRMHRYVRQPDLAWKSGVVFERAGSQALVTEAWGSRNIRLRARGPQAKELLTLLAEDFDKMHERLEGLRVKKMIPCNCQACVGTAEPHFYEHDDLARRKSLGKRTIECKISFDDVPVADLLDGVFAKNMSNPRTLLESGGIEEALRLLLPNQEASLLLGQLLGAEKEFLHQRIGPKEFEEVKSKVLAAAMRLT